MVKPPSERRLPSSLGAFVDIPDRCYPLSCTVARIRMHQIRLITTPGAGWGRARPPRPASAPVTPPRCGMRPLVQTVVPGGYGDDELGTIIHTISRLY